MENIRVELQKGGDDERELEGFLMGDNVEQVLFVCAVDDSRNIRIPRLGTSELGGYEFATPSSFIIEKQSFKQLCLGYKLSMEKNMYGLLTVRSSMAKKGIILLGGVIDSAYQGEIICMLYNASDEDIIFYKNDYVIQFLFNRKKNIRLHLCTDQEYESIAGPPEKRE